MLEAENRLWNGVSGRSIAVIRFETGSTLPSNADIRGATLNVVSTFTGASGTANTRSLGIQWANSAASDGWSMADWPTSVSPDAYSGDPTISTTEGRYFNWSFNLLAPQTIAHPGGTAYTGLMVFVQPDDLPGTDQYFTSDFVSFEAPTGPQAYGDQAPQLNVYYCVP